MLGGGRSWHMNAMPPPHYVTDDEAGCTAGAVCLISPVWAGLGLV